MVPAIAVADALRAEGASVSFIGTRDRAEAELVPAAGYEIDFLQVAGLDRRNPLRAAAALLRSAAAVRTAGRLLRERRADVVLGGGGYVSGPVGVAARRLGLPLVLTEADSHLGLTNRLLARRARRVCLAFPIAGREHERYLVTGRPVPDAVIGADHAAARRRFNLGEHQRCLLVVGGSLGARSINEAALAAFLQRPDRRVIHVAGRRDFADLRERHRAAGSPPHYTLLEYEPGLGELLAASDLVLARSGGSVFEIAAAGRPAVLVPYPHATGDHQTHNARWMAEAGAAAVIDDAELTPQRLDQVVGELLGDEARLRRMAAASRSLARPDAARRVAAEVLAAAAGAQAAGSDAAEGEARTAVSEGRWSGRRLHFIAIGGAGMSGLALVADHLGAEVSGSDSADSSYVERLRAAGIEPRIGHDAEAVPADAEVVVSTAIGDDNPELAIARERRQRVLHRGELLAELCAERRLLAVAGTHGKTTTAAMAIWALRETGADPGFFLGGELPGAGANGEAANAGWGGGEWVVAEADESDASFLRLRPEVAVITNLELDHHSHWSSLAELARAFSEFAAPAAGLAVAAELRLDRPSDAGDRAEIRFGLEPAPGEPPPERRPDLLAGEIEATGQGGSRFRAEGAGIEVAVELGAPGRHNVADALAAIAGLRLAGMDAAGCAAALASFPGVARRLQFKGEAASGARVYDDYAHHPTEVAAVLEAARELGGRRLIAVFQPHLYSRTKALAPEFGAALAAADEVAVLDVYPAREEPVGELAGVSGRMVAEAAAEHAGGRPVWWLPDADQAGSALAPHLTHEDVVLTIGAGDIFRLADALVAGNGSPS